MTLTRKSRLKTSKTPTQTMVTDRKKSKSLTMTLAKTILSHPKNALTQMATAMGKDARLVLTAHLMTL
ncbi:MAG: hypothetical protein BWX66_01844 [Deltaproteobacteria bacterium ADurb.Bin058]|nr:MAG: hypothetical protein BWX66_01844 [Deltaproteobacteria bacterium ADurb.Bin058]